MTSPLISQASLEDVLLAFNLTRGNLRPVDRLLSKDELYGVLNDYTFAGAPAALPYFLFAQEPYPSGATVEFWHAGRHAFSVLVDHCYSIDKVEVASLMFGTADRSHPGVAKLFDAPGFVVAGVVSYFRDGCVDVPYCDVESVGDVVFQSRNPPHRAHEAIVSRYAPSLTYSTPFGTAKASDYPFDRKIAAYRKMADLYGVSIYVTTLPRVFAGPREALQNCLLFQNKGAKRFVMGRGKNCVGDFYSETASYELCRDFFERGLIAIEPVWQETIEIGGIEPKGSAIKREFIDRGVTPPESLMSGYISILLLEPQWAG